MFGALKARKSVCKVQTERGHEDVDKDVPEDDDTDAAAATEMRVTEAEELEQNLEADVNLLIFLIRDDTFLLFFLDFFDRRLDLGFVVVIINSRHVVDL